MKTKSVECEAAAEIEILQTMPSRERGKSNVIKTVF